MALVIASVAVGYVEMLPGGPVFWRVYPFTVFLPALMIGRPWQLEFLPLTIAASVIVMPIMLGWCRLRLWSLLPALGLLVWAWRTFVLGAGDGVDCQSLGYVIFCGIMQLLFTGTFIALWRWNRKTRTFASAAAFHGVACIWLASYAFPWYGELP